MNGITLFVLIVIGIIGLFIIYKIIKPYFIKHDTTWCVCGGLGSSKTLHSVAKDPIILLRKQRIKYYYWGNFKRAIANFFRKIVNKSRAKKLKKRSEWLYNHPNKPLPRHLSKKLKPAIEIKPYNKKPMLYCNIPVHFKSHLFGFKREWALKFKASHMLCLEEIIEYSVVSIDEFPQFINQFNWNNELIQKNVNEFITFFRHYIGGYLLMNAQSLDEIVCQVRRKLNIATFCFDFHKWGWPIPLFYTVRMCDIQLTDEITTISTSFIEENTKLHFGLFPPKGTYDSRCYSVRYKNIYKKSNYTKEDFYNDLKLSKVLRLVKYESPLDDIRTEQQKQKQWEKGEEIWKN